MILFCDIETTGVPRNYKAPATDTDNWPRMVSIAWQVYTEDGSELKDEFYTLIRPDGYTIPADATDIHGISTEQAQNDGATIEDALEWYDDISACCNRVVGHNISFDLNVIAAEYWRVRKTHVITGGGMVTCTMKASTNICKLPGAYGYKWPKLTELHRHLFGCDMQGAHNALDDVKATAKCYFEMKRLGLL